MSDTNQTQQLPEPPPPPPGAAVTPPPQPPGGATPQVQQVAPASETAARHARRLQGKVPISDVTIIVGRKNLEGQRTEEMNNIDGRDFRITGFSEVVVEKMQKVKDDQGNLMGFEPTGEYELTVKVRYVVE